MWLNAWRRCALHLTCSASPFSTNRGRKHPQQCTSPVVWTGGAAQAMSTRFEIVEQRKERPNYDLPHAHSSPAGRTLNMGIGRQARRKALPIMSRSHLTILPRRYNPSARRTTFWSINADGDFSGLEATTLLPGRKALSIARSPAPQSIERSIIPQRFS
ncbi:hypothetical protein VUR80DRAFT_1639 [Thermomyces stellatus]